MTCAHVHQERSVISVSSLIERKDGDPLMARIRHLAIFTDDPDELAKFYVDVFGMTITQPLASSPESGSWVFLTDGYMDVALISPSERKGAKNGPNHFGFTMDEKERVAVLEKLRKRGIEPRKSPPERPYVEDRVRDIHGNAIDLSSTGLRGPVG
jgi:catechol 2,3-dioxygenase-like lactoylglutathione lyase family enzyme